MPRSRTRARSRKPIDQPTSTHFPPGDRHDEAVDDVGIRLDRRASRRSPARARAPAGPARRRCARSARPTSWRFQSAAFRPPPWIRTNSVPAVERRARRPGSVVGPE
jgi:hypothetical protein